MTDTVSIDLIDTALLCGLDIAQHTISQYEVQARCPFCNDYKYRMYLCSDPQRPLFWCHNCGTGGNAVTLYAQFNPSGIVLTTREAYRQLINHPAVRTGFFEYNDKPVPRRIKPLEERSAIYLELLRLLRLEKKHADNLRRRGLSNNMIAGNMYRSIPTDWRFRQNVADTLAACYDLSDMPGFYTEDSRWSLAGCSKSGIIIPICDHNNLIQGLQIRLDDLPPKRITMPDGSIATKKGTRFHWFSSGGKYYQDKNGTGTSSYIHVVGDVSSDVLHITEGAMKADIASYLSDGELFIGLTGVQNTRYLADVVRTLRPKEIVECIDMDVRTNTDVQRAQAKIQSICMNLCDSYHSFYWPIEQKGIDDWLLFQKLKNKMVT